MKIVYNEKTYRLLGWAELDCKLRFQQEDSEDCIEVSVHTLMNEDELQVIPEDGDPQSSRILAELHETEDLYQAKCREVFSQKQDQSAYGEGYDNLWNRFWKEFGRELAEKRERLEGEYIKELRREVKVGDGMTIFLFSDRDPCTVIARTAKTITVQEDKAERDPAFAPEWEPGGFSAICTNEHDQKWNISRNPDGAIYKFYWSEKFGAWRAGGDGSIKAAMGRSKFYDYNF